MQFAEQGKKAAKQVIKIPW